MAEDEEVKSILKKKLRRLMKRGSKEERVEGIIQLEASNFEEVLKNADAPILVDFWAGWCAPCLMMAPVIEELARDYSGKVVFAKLDVDKNLEIASRYQIMSIPTFMIFKGGRPVERIMGAVGRKPLEEALRRHLPQ